MNGTGTLSMPGSLNTNSGGMTFNGSAIGIPNNGETAWRAAGASFPASSARVR